LFWGDEISRLFGFAKAAMNRSCRLGAMKDSTNAFSCGFMRGFYLTASQRSYKDTTHPCERCSCAARVKKSGAGTIPARRLLDYVRLLPDSDVQTVRNYYR